MTALHTTERTHTDMDRGAEISACGRYRYRLWRRWGDGQDVLWIMCNPSTAGALTDDPTIRRCVAFATAWGYGGIRVVNLCALRSRAPGVLRWLDVEDEVNATVLREELQRNDKRIAAWGALVETNPLLQRAAALVEQHRLECLGTTKAGHPRHPLYVPAGATPVPYNPANAALGATR